MNRITNYRPGRTLTTATLFLTLACTVARAQVNKPADNKKNPTTPVRTNNPAPVTAAPADSVIEERLVELALKAPLYDAAEHQVKISNFKVKSAKKSWFNLLTLSANYNDQTFATQVPGTQYVYPKYFFGLTIPVGTIVSKGVEVKSAREDVKVSLDNRDNLARTIRMDVLSKYKQYKTYRALVVLQSQVSDDVHAAFLQAEKRFNDGSITIETYNDASRNNTSELTKLLNLQLQQDLIKLDIERMIGVKLETVIN